MGEAVLAAVVIRQVHMRHTVGEQRVGIEQVDSPGADVRGVERERRKVAELPDLIEVEQVDGAEGQPVPRHVLDGDGNPRPGPDPVQLRPQPAMVARLPPEGGEGRDVEERRAAQGHPPVAEGRMHDHGARVQRPGELDRPGHPLHLVPGPAVLQRPEGRVEAEDGDARRAGDLREIRGVPGVPAIVDHDLQAVVPGRRGQPRHPQGPVRVQGSGREGNHRSARGHPAASGRAHAP